MKLTQEEKLKVMKERIGGETRAIYYRPWHGRGGLQLLGYKYEVDGDKLAKLLLELTDK